MTVGVETGNTFERRKRTRETTPPAQATQLWVERADASWEKIAAKITDTGEYGYGVLLREQLRDGQAVLVERSGRTRGHVAWCTPASAGVFRAGIAMDDARTEATATGDDFEDFYETLEVNPAASLDTVHKIYRILAQRVHPDNPESGNEEQFKRLIRAYRVLSDPEQRAAFDAVRSRMGAKQWRIFDPESALPGLEQEQRKRRGILSALYTKRMRQPENCGVSIPEMEQLLTVPREHLEFPLWFLKEQGWILRTDGGKHHITAKGVEHAEATGAWQPPMARNARLLPSGLEP